MTETITTAVKFNTKTSNARIETRLRAADNTSICNENVQPSHNVPKFTYFHMVTIVISILTYMLDIFFASYLSYFYFIEGRVTYFALTIVFIALPNLVTTAFSMRWYIIDDDTPPFERPSTLTWVVRIVLLLLQMAQVLRYGDTFLYGVQMNLCAGRPDRQRVDKVHRKLLDEDSDSSLLRLFHCFLHAAPQAVLHSMMLIHHLWQKDRGHSVAPYVMWIQCCAVGSWMVSIAWGLTTYQRASRLAREDKDKMTIAGALVQFLWHFVSVLSRILALSFLAAIFPVWFAAVCLIHWLIMASWLALGHQQTAVCASRCEELTLSAMLALAYVIAFIAPRDGPTRYAYLVYYLVCFMENTGALVVWCVANSSESNALLYYGAVCLQLGTFLLAIAFMLLYYTHFHPSGTSVSIHKSIDFSHDLSKPGLSKT